jgi:hypothetical protein
MPDSLLLFLQEQAQNPYKARMWSSTSQSIPASPFYNRITFDTVSYDPNSNLTTGASSQYTAPVDGYYFACGRVSQATSPGTRTIVTLYVNGAEAQRGFDGTSATAVGGPSSGILQLNKGDLVALYMGIGSAVSTEGFPSAPALQFLTVHYLSPL